MSAALPQVEKLAVFERPTALGFPATVHSYKHDSSIVFAITKGSLDANSILVRVQSPCLFGESFGVNSCDCGAQLNDALSLAASSEAFVLIYLSDQEGRGHGMETKIQVIAMEANEGMEMPDTFRKLGLELDLRSYAVAAAILKDLIGEKPIRLLTNNPKKVKGLTEHGITVEREPLVVKNPTAACQRYLHSKRREMGHLLPESYE